MLSPLEARGAAAGRAAAARARIRLADALSRALPGVSVTIEQDGIVLFGRLTMDDARLRWIGSLL